MEVNYFGLINVTQAALPLLRASKGTLINVASMAAFLAMGGTAPYTASKHAVLGVKEALHAELSPLGDKVIAALPGGFRTDRKSVVQGKSASVRVHLGGCRIFNKTTTIYNTPQL